MSLEKYSVLWHLEMVRLVDYFSVNCLFFCHSSRYGEAVLKIGTPGRETCTEVQALREYNGGRYCCLLESDVDNGVILLERITPGIRLRDESRLEERIKIFSDLYNGLHIRPNNADLYPSYGSWIYRITDYMKSQKGNPELYKYMKKAKELYLELSRIYRGQYLLHGDLHQDNILLSQSGEYIIIDPKGVVGDPVFDAARFVLNENEPAQVFDEKKRKLGFVLDYLSASLNIPVGVLQKCYFIDAVMSNCWSLESRQPPDMECVTLAEQLLN